MEGKAVLFKKFANIDCFDIEVNEPDPEKLAAIVCALEPTFGAINLEDIKAPECFEIERRLKALCDIPVFHDDQHGTAIICAAGIINALHLTGRDIKTTKVVLNGAGAAGIACIALLKAMGLPHDNAILLDRTGVLSKSRTDLDQWKSAHAVETSLETLEEALVGADVFIGLSVAGIVTKEMVQNMAAKPILFAMANPVPEIMPEEVKAVLPDAIMATGRSDYPNQVNNVLGFPYIFRGALDVQASTINEEMKVAAAQALAELAREDVPDEVGMAYGQRLTYGPDYIIPAPFDPRLIYKIPPAVAKAAMDTGVARKPIADLDTYARQLQARLDPTASVLQLMADKAKLGQRRVVFAEGQDARVVRAAHAFARGGFGEAIVVGRADEIAQILADSGLEGGEADLTIINAENSEYREEYTDHLYSKLQRRGFLRRDCYRLIARDRHIFGACILALDHADTMITGMTRKSAVVLADIGRVFEVRPGHKVVGVSLVIARDKTVLVADTTVHEMPTGEELADIAEQGAAVARSLGFTPRVALLSYSTFGYPQGDRSERIQEAVALLEQRKVNFEFDGEMAVDVALDEEFMKSQYPFCALSGAANVLVMPSRHSGSIATKMLNKLEESTIIGPILMGMERPVQICSMSATSAEILNMAILSAARVGG
jgi:malate dehydrogenase (oxaloacetate-decarboxylating)(NADP+)